jgi:hypothetical protein
MKTHTTQLSERRILLVQQCRAERQLLTEQAHTLQQGLTMVNCAWLVLGKVRQYPALCMAGLALSATLAATLKPRRLFALAKNAYVGWQLAQRVLPLIKNLMQSRKQT